MDTNRGIWGMVPQRILKIRYLRLAKNTFAIQHFLQLFYGLYIYTRLYYEKKLENCKSNNRATWKLLNEIICKKKAKVIQTSAFKADNLEISDPEEIANRFCNYFTNIGPNLAENTTFHSLAYGLP